MPANLIITPNQAVASVLKKQQLSTVSTPSTKSTQVVIPTNIMVLNAWIHQQWNELVDNAHTLTFDSEQCTIPKKRLSSIQVKALWSEVLDYYSDDIAGQNHQQWLEIVVQGWKQLRQGNINSKQLAQYEQHINIKFSQWVNRFEWLLEKNNYYTDEHIVDYLIQYYQQPSGVIRTEKCVISLVGFGQSSDLQSSSHQPITQLFPHHQKLLALASSQPLIFQPLVTQTAQVSQALFEQQSIDDELDQALYWAQSKPNKQISIVVPDIQQRLLVIQRIIHKQSTTDIALGGATCMASIAEYSTLQLLLRWLHQGLNFNDSLQLFQSPFWAISTEIDVQASIENLLFDDRKKNPYSQPNKLVNAATSAEYFNKNIIINESENLLTIIKNLEWVADTNDQFKQKPSMWLSYFFECFERLAVQHPDKDLWEHLQEKCYQQFMQLNATVTSYNYQQALDWFNQITQMPIPRLLQDKPIRIIDTVEGAIGSDIIWICSVDNQHWPSPVKQHPLLPITLLRDAQLPRSTPELEVELCQHLFSLLENNCEQLIYSYRTDANEPDLGLSALLHVRQFPLLKVETLLDIKSFNVNLQRQWIKDDRVPVLTDEEKQHSKGGSGLIKAMGQCLFSTFIQYRLKANPRYYPQIGITPLMRGNLTHHAMEYLGKRINSHQALIQLSEQELISLCSQAIDWAIQQLTKNIELEPVLIDVEKSRLMAILLNWFEIEYRRSDFIIIETETTKSLNILGLQLHLKVDRIDKNEQGELLIIDYKTSQSISQNKLITLEGKSTKKIDYTASTPPSEPQLPLYVLADNSGKTTAVAFAQLNTQDQKFKGLGAQGSWSIAGINDADWQSLEQYWRQSIDMVVGEYVDGKITINQQSPVEAFITITRNLEER